MSPRHFSGKYGPYFVNDGFSKHSDQPATGFPVINRIKSFFISRRKKRQGDQS